MEYSHWGSPKIRTHGGSLRPARSVEAMNRRTPAGFSNPNERGEHHIAFPKLYVADMRQGNVGLHRQLRLAHTVFNPSFSDP